MINDKQILDTAKSIFSSINVIDAGRVTYLRLLVQGAQDALAGKRVPKAEQLTALNEVHTRFYELVLQAAEEFVPKGTKGRAVELHRRANFARTALSALRNHVRAGGDLATLKAATVMKSTLKQRNVPARPPTARRLRARAERESKGLMATIIALTDTDKAAAVEEIQLVMGQLASRLVELGVVATKDAAQSARERRPLKLGKTLFMPTDTQVLAQRANPS